MNERVKPSSNRQLNDLKTLQPFTMQFNKTLLSIIACLLAFAAASPVPAADNGLAVEARQPNPQDDCAGTLQHSWSIY